MTSSIPPSPRVGAGLSSASATARSPPFRAWWTRYGSPWNPKAAVADRSRGRHSGRASCAYGVHLSDVVEERMAASWAIKVDVAAELEGVRGARGLPSRRRVAPRSEAGAIAVRGPRPRPVEDLAEPARSRRLPAGRSARTRRGLRNPPVALHGPAVPEHWPGAGLARYRGRDHESLRSDFSRIGCLRRRSRHRLHLQAEGVDVKRSAASTCVCARRRASSRRMRVDVELIDANEVRLWSSVSTAGSLTSSTCRTRSRWQPARAVVASAPRRTGPLPRSMDHSFLLGLLVGWLDFLHQARAH